MSKNNHATNYSKNLNKTYTSETKLYIDDTTQQKNYTIDESAKNELKISSDMELITSKEEKKYSIYKFMRILCIIGFAIFTILFFNEIIIQPYRIKKSVDLTRTLYYRPSNELTTTTSPTLAPTNIVVSTTPIPEVVTVESGLNPNKDELGRLLTFKNLLSENDDVKGWITIKDTNIDYVVMQSEVNDPNYYLHKDINKKYSKAGTLYLDIMSSVDNNTQNYVIHGHNMVSTHEKMFHYLLEYKDISYYKEHPIISFDTIYNTGL
jgi:sortase B